jgi:ribosomal protein S18 acetylase RimI-like enzyme
MNIRPMAKSDQAGVIRLWQDCGLIRPWNDPARDLRTAMRTSDAAVLVGEDAGTIVASVMAGFDGHRGWIYYLAVAQDRRQEGLGRAMFETAQAWLKARGAPKIQLMVRETNEEAIGFYKAMGLEVQPVVTLGRFLRD